MVFPHLLLKSLIQAGFLASEQDIVLIVNALFFGVLLVLFLSMVSDPRPTQSN